MERPVPIDLAEPPLLTRPPHKRWTRAEYESVQAATSGQEKLELVDGELISKIRKKRPHVNALILLHTWLAQVFGPRCVHPEAPIDVAPEDNPSSEPEPDLIVTKDDLSNFLVCNPRPADLLLVVEIADSTLAFDLGAKARLYARAAIKEYWVLDVSGSRMIVHRDPGSGAYGSVAVYGENESVSPLAAPNAALRVGSVVPR